VRWEPTEGWTAGPYGQPPPAAPAGPAVGDLLTGPTLAQEILRSVVGTIGLVAAVPITTGLAALVADIRHHPASDVDDEDDDEDDEGEDE
jgi:hypothetical protein